MSSQVRQRSSNEGTKDFSTKRPRETNNKRNKYANLQKELQIATSSATHRRWTRTVIIFAVITLVYFYTQNRTRETKFALVREILPLRMQKFQCSTVYEAEFTVYPNCIPKKCGRLVTDKLIEVKEAELLLDLAQRILTKTKTTGGAAILDIHTGALTYEAEFINVYKVEQLMQELREEHLVVYNFVKGKIKQAIAEQFGISTSSLYLTYPTFFSRLTNETAKTVHDEYWHEHVDKETYPSFHYTSLLYLNTYDKNFKGGRFIFVDGTDKNRTTSAIEPKQARVIAFTSGAENRHHVEPVVSGERYAVTISFTCDQKLGISDPKIQTKVSE